MKGWIKVHEHDNEVAVPVRAIQTVQAYEYEKAHGFIQTNAVGNIYFNETYEEVLAIIEEAENAGADAIEGLARVLEAHMEETRAYISYIGDGDDTGDASYLRGREAALKDILDLLRKETSRWER